MAYLTCDEALNTLVDQQATIIAQNEQIQKNQYELYKQIANINKIAFGNDNINDTEVSLIQTNFITEIAT
jgi:alpha-glucuronidase